MADDIIADFAGHTAQEMCLLNQKISTQPQMKDDLKRILDRISNSMQNKKFLLVVSTKVLPPTDYQTTVIKILNNTDDNQRIVAQKMQEENISTCD